MLNMNTTIAVQLARLLKKTFSWVFTRILSTIKNNRGVIRFVLSSASELSNFMFTKSFIQQISLYKVG